MLDFLKIETRMRNRNFEIYPKFLIKKSEDLMIKGSDFYAVWCEDRQLWSTDEMDVIRIVDDELRKFADEYHNRTGAYADVMYMYDGSSGSIDTWHKYVQKQNRDNFKQLDETLQFADSVVDKKNYSSKRLPYSLTDMPTPAWDRLVGTLYIPEERHKIEWCIGAIISGASKNIQKFLVFYGSAGTGKSTIINIIEMLFDGYYSTFDSKAVGSASASFALESFRSNPLVAIQHDGDLSRIDDNTRLNSIVSHELMEINQKFRSAYPMRINSFLIMGTNKPVRITDAKSGLIRRLIDVSPSGDLVPPNEYNTLMDNVKYELGGIAKHCLDVYNADPLYYNGYLPIAMMGATNDIYNFCLDNYYTFEKEKNISLALAWDMYKQYVEDTKMEYSMNRRKFKDELKNYFDSFSERYSDGDNRTRSMYMGFKTEKFKDHIPKTTFSSENGVQNWLAFYDNIESVLDKTYADCPAQLAVTYEGKTDIPEKKWENVTTTLKDINSHNIHYVRIPECLIVIDFDIPDENGDKNFERNYEAASKWPPTYAELSKSGAGIHLHYIYTGDLNALSRIYDDHVEIKVYTGKQALRRKLTKCNNLPIATISSGLPLREEKPSMIEEFKIKDQRHLENRIRQILNKENIPGTKVGIDFIYNALENAYNGGIEYNVENLKHDVLVFAMHSTNNADYCVKMVNQMKFKSVDSEPMETQSDRRDDSDIVFFDYEVFKNVCFLNAKIRGADESTMMRWINPTPSDIEEFCRKYKLVGFNNLDYDNNISWAIMMGYNNYELYKLSKALIDKDKNVSRKAKFRQSKNLSYSDVYDFMSAGNKMSLKKWEIKLGITHMELGLDWDEPVPPELWPRVSKYCDNDVISTEKTFECPQVQADWLARKILADLANGSYNDRTNELTTRLIFGNNRKPQNEFCYRDLSKPVYNISKDMYEFLMEKCPEMMETTHGPANSVLPYFEGYEFKDGKSTYMGEEVGEGGEVFADLGSAVNVALMDISSQHPHSAIAEMIFGPRFTRIFSDIVESRVSIKHKAWSELNSLLDGRLTKYIKWVEDGLITEENLADALKTAINSVYGLTSAKFDNPFRDPRNVDNIVAKRGALFMITLRHEVEKRGFRVVHIKTDSIKIENANKDILDFVYNFGKLYGYTFEHEATYDRMCLVNKSTYIAKYATVERCEKLYGKDYVWRDDATCKKNKKKGDKWDATGEQFAVPYVFKTMFSNEPITIDDMAETFSVKDGALYLDWNGELPDYRPLEAELKSLENKYKKGLINDTTFETSCSELNEQIEKCHNYKFIGRVGQFTPVRDKDKSAELWKIVPGGKPQSPAGSKGYRWVETQVTRDNLTIDDIDKSYYQKQVDDAIRDISLYCSYDWFIDGESKVMPTMVYDEEYKIERPMTDEEMPFY